MQAAGQQQATGQRQRGAASISRSMGPESRLLNRGLSVTEVCLEALGNGLAHVHSRSRCRESHQPSMTSVQWGSELVRRCSHSLPRSPRWYGHMATSPTA